MRSRMFVSFILALLVASLVATACSALAGKPTVVIASPPSGSQFSEGEDIAVQSTSTDATAVVRVELVVDGATVRTDPSPIPQGQPALSLIQTWKATSGTHTIMVRAYNASGAVSDPVAISVSVSPVIARGPTPTATVPLPVTAAPPTTTLSPTSVPPTTAPGACTDNAAFVADVTVPDGFVLPAGQAFNKIWRLSNNGTCTWSPGYQFVFVSGEAMATTTVIAVPNTAPGATADLLVAMAAPTAPGEHSGRWRMRNPSGTLFGQTVAVKINVLGAPPPGPTTPAPPSGCSGTPNIESFTASPGTITSGGSSTLSWGSVTNADSAEIDQGIGGVETPGSTIVTPGSTTTYTLTARCGANVATRQATVVVNPVLPTAPAAPTALTASAPAAGQIQLNWTDNSGNENGFRIYRGGVPIAEVAANTSAYLNTGLPCGTSYTYFVRAYNDAGESGPSNTVTQSTLACPPTVPAAPSNATSATISPSQIRVYWRDNSTNETGFRVYQNRLWPLSDIVVATVGPGAGSGSTLNATISGLSCGISDYKFYVRAYNAAGESAASNETTNNTSGCPVTVNFTSVHVYDDEDLFGAGELWFDFNVNGVTRRWPTSGTVTVNSGDTKTISGTSVTLSLMRTTNLSISVKGTDEDSPPLDPNDSLGTASATYTSSSNWSEGSHCTESASPHDFRICYSISD